MSSLKLYQLTSEYEKAINEMLLSAQEGREQNDLVMEIKDSFENKVIAVAKYIKSLEAESAAIKKASDEMLARSKAIANNAESLREYLQYNIEKTGLLDKIKCEYFVISLQLNPPKLVVDDVTKAPEMYIKTKTVKELDNAAIKQDIIDGFEIEGFRIERSKRLVIK